MRVQSRTDRPSFSFRKGSMRYSPLLLASVVVLGACDSQAKQQLRSLAHADSMRTDSLVGVKNDLLSEVMTSTQFVNDLNSQMAKLKSRTPKRLSTTLTRESDMR